MQTEEQVRPRIMVEMLPAEDPEFEAGSVHTARALLTNPTTKDWTYSLKLYLGVQGHSAVVGQAAIPAGGSVNVDFTVTMPTAEGTYTPFLDVTIEGYPDFLEHREGTVASRVTILASPAIDIGDITWV